jgi:hypothetical protein
VQFALIGHQSSGVNWDHPELIGLDYAAIVCRLKLLLRTSRQAISVEPALFSVDILSSSVTASKPNGVLSKTVVAQAKDKSVKASSSIKASLLSKPVSIKPSVAKPSKTSSGKGTSSTVPAKSSVSVKSSNSMRKFPKLPPVATLGVAFGDGVNTESAGGIVNAESAGVIVTNPAGVISTVELSRMYEWYLRNSTEPGPVFDIPIPAPTPTPTPVFVRETVCDGMGSGKFDVPTLDPDVTVTEVSVQTGTDDRSRSRSPPAVRDEGVSDVTDRDSDIGRRLALDAALRWENDRSHGDRMDCDRHSRARSRSDRNSAERLLDRQRNDRKPESTFS